MPRRVRPRRLGPLLCSLLIVAGTPGCTVLDRFTGTAAPSRTPAPAVVETTAPADLPPLEPVPVSAEQLAQLRTTTQPARSGFCDLLADDQVRAALGQARVDVLPPVSSLQPGDLAEIDLPNGETQRLPVAEYACRWELLTGPSADRAPGSRAAGVTVFAPPVTPARAAALAQAARSRPGCTELPTAPTVGLPGTTTTCGPGELRSEGRIGETWLACEITREDLTGRGSTEVLVPRLLSWCGHALQQLDVEES